MIKTEIPAERILQVVMPGTIVVVGTWYLHRPFLMKYFPAIAGDAKATDIGLPQLAFVPSYW
jgi:hypothetical protein